MIYNVETPISVEVINAQGCKVTNSGALVFTNTLNIPIQGYQPDEWKRFWIVKKQ